MAQGKKVLVIDDDAASSSLIGQTLELCGLEVTAVSDARSGFETAKLQVPDLIFISLLLPEINGLKVSKAIHSVETLKAVPIIMILARSGEIDPRYTSALGIADVLVRPFSSDEIVAKARAVLGDDALEPVAEEEGIEPVVVIDEDEETADEVFAAAEEVTETPYAIQGAVHGSAAAEERDAGNKGTELRFERENMAEERDLFSAVQDTPEEETTPARNDFNDELHVSGTSDLSADDYEPEAGEAAPNPVRRGLMIAASIAAGIALGIGGYLFFTAGNRQLPARKQVTKVLPAPAAVAPAAPVAPAEKPGSIAEIPVKQEPEDQGTAKQPQAKVKEPGAREGKAAEKSPEVRQQPARKEKAASKPAAPEGQYYLQAGLFGNKDNASALAAKIRTAGFEASVKTVDGPDRKTLYRVVAGTYTSHKKAVEMSQSLDRKGIKAIVRRK